MSQLDKETKHADPEKAEGPHLGTLGPVKQQTETTKVKLKKKKRRYTQGWGTIQNVERGVSQGLETVTEGVARVFSVYSKESKKSARNKRDGALRDGIENWTKALSKGMRIAGKAPFDFVKAVNRGKGSKQVRDTVKAITPPPFR